MEIVQNRLPIGVNCCLLAASDVRVSVPPEPGAICPTGVT